MTTTGKHSSHRSIGRASPGKHTGQFLESVSTIQTHIADGIPHERYDSCLPTEDEWEKLPVVDGRFYPWGDRLATFCKMAESRAGTPMPERVGSSERIASTLFDVAGLVREYCNSPFARDTDTRVVRGGSYLTANELGCRVTYRQSVQRHIPSLEHGFRVVRDVGSVQGTHERKMVRPQF